MCGPSYWKKYVQRRMMSGLASSPCAELKVLTVTAPGAATALWNEQAREHFTALIARLRKLFPAAHLEYWKVGETQLRGVVHYHVVVRPLRYLPKKTLEGLCVDVGLGPVCYVQAVREHKGGAKGLLGYLGKYLLKDVAGWDPAWGHVVTHSHGWSLDWKPRCPGAGVCVWCSCEIDVYLELRRREAVIGSQFVSAPDHAATLTAGLSPPTSTEGVAVS